MGVRRVVPNFTTQSLDAATAFYGDVLGLRPVMDHGWVVTIVHPLTDEPWGVRRFFVRDPDGHVINVLSHR